MRYILLLFITFPAFAKTTRVAILDTGFNMGLTSYVPLCDSGHRDLTGSGMHDTNGHGTNVAGLIDSTAAGADYCIVNIKVFDTSRGVSKLIEGLIYAYSLNVDIINVSAGGIGENIREFRIIKKILNKKIKLIVAAGNNGKNLNNRCNYFPACYDNRIVVIGNKSDTSNYGDVVDFVIEGDEQEALGVTLSGSSQSTAKFTGSYIKGRQNVR